MNASLRMSSFALLIILFGAALTCPVHATEEKEEDALPKVGDEAKDFKLISHRGEEIVLSEQLEKGPVVLLVLRGYPGYQCPICTKQVADFLARTQGFVAQKAQVFMVYPGSAEDLGEHAKEFLNKKKLPKPLHLLLDPDFEFTKLYNLRWDEPRETAYPSTFVIGQDGKITFAKISKEHGDRTTAKEVLAAMKGEKK